MCGFYHPVISCQYVIGLLYFQTYSRISRMWGRKESSDVKVILPGEMGMSNGGQIGTFAVGSGCRGYLAYDQESAMGG